MKDKAKKIKKDNPLLNALLAPVFYMIIGVVCIILREKFIDILGFVLGGSFIIAGSIFVIVFLIRDARRNFNRNDMLIGLGAIAIGVAMLIQLEILKAMLPLILGILVIISGAAKLQKMVNMVKLHFDGWMSTLIVAVLNIALGVIMVCNPKAFASFMMLLIGIGLVFSAMTDIIFTLYYDKQLNDKNPFGDDIEAEYEEIPVAEK